MSRQKFDAVTREAFWDAYDRKCVYTSEVLDLHTMHIDHVIPESLLDDRPELDRVLADLGLPADFDIQGFGNLVAAKTQRNLQKGDLLLSTASLRFFLDIANARKRRVEENIGKIKGRLAKGMSLVRIEQLVTAGHLTKDDLQALASKSSDESFRLLKSMRFLDESEVASLTSSDVANLMERPIQLGENVDMDGLLLGHDSGEERHVRSCTEYQKALREGFYARTTFEMKMSVFFEHQCGTLAALARATLAARSYIADPRVGLADVHLLPYSLFPDVAAGSEDGRENDDSSYADKIESGSLVIRRVSSHLLVVEEPEGMGQQLIEVVRADFDGDGLEEMLVHEYSWATHGTLGFGGAFLLARRTPDGPLEPTALPASLTHQEP